MIDTELGVEKLARRVKEHEDAKSSLDGDIQSVRSVAEGPCETEGVDEQLHSEETERITPLLKESQGGEAMQVTDCCKRDAERMNVQNDDGGMPQKVPATTTA